MKTNEKIFSRMQTNNTLVCCGLDPDLLKIPLEIRNQYLTAEEQVFRFLCQVVNSTNQHVCVYKAQKAFFDLLPGGHDVLREVIHYIHVTFPNLPVIIDCKIGDIDNTMNAYMENLFGLLNADGVVVNPYMGEDVILPLIEMKDKAIVVLAKTSNSGGDIIQDSILQNGQYLWQYILELAVGKWNKHGNIIPVLSANAHFDARKTRLVIPNSMPILLAGVGAQGGSLDNVRNLLNTENMGVFVNSSRGLLYPSKGDEWRLAIEQAVIELKNTLNQERVA